jgi:Holliday junction resolvasome RuvABC endonuclease subunit
VNVLGIDAATTTGWAVVGPEGSRMKVLAHGRMTADWSGIEQLLAGLVVPVEVAAVESPYLDKNPDTTITLARIVGRFEQVLDRRGVRTELVKAASWQQGLLDRLIRPSSTRAQRKFAAKLWVRASYRLDVSEDEADAICLATWQAKHELFNARAAAR